jgi:hypothetical protein
VFYSAAVLKICSLSPQQMQVVPKDIISGLLMDSLQTNCFPTRQLLLLLLLKQYTSGFLLANYPKTDTMGV